MFEIQLNIQSNERAGDGANVIAGDAGNRSGAHNFVGSADVADDRGKEAAVVLSLRQTRAVRWP